MSMAEVIANRVNKDIENGVTALWHDESHMNRYLIDNPPKLELSPSYCYAEEFYGTDYPYEPKIIALKKNHNELRT
jgi:histo-blood group ABO system transferase